MDVCCNPVTKTLDACLRRHDEIIPDSFVARMKRSVIRESTQTTIRVLCVVCGLSGL